MALQTDPLKYNKEFPDMVYAVAEDGTFINKMDAVKTKLQNTQYWQNHTRKIGIIMLISSLMLFVIILFETDIIQFVWDNILTFLGVLI